MSVRQMLDRIETIRDAQSERLTCPGCGRRFDAVRFRQVHCSPGCIERAARRERARRKGERLPLDAGNINGGVE